MSNDIDLSPITDDERSELAACEEAAPHTDQATAAMLEQYEAPMVVVVLVRALLAATDSTKADVAWLYVHTLVRLANVAAELRAAGEAFDAETAKRLEHEQTIADLRAQLEQLPERIARAIEVKQGDRCPTCQGRAANWETAARCGGGHRWTRPSRDVMAHVDFAGIARRGGAA